MARWSATALIEWREPHAYRMYREAGEAQRRSPWSRPLLVVGVVALCLLPWLAGTLDTRSHRPSLTLMSASAVAAGLVVVYVAPWILTLLPSYISITDKGVRWIRGHAVTWFSYPTISHCAIRDLEIEGLHLPVLEITFTKRRPLQLGIDTAIPLDALADALRRQNVRVRS